MSSCPESGARRAQPVQAEEVQPVSQVAHASERIRLGVLDSSLSRLDPRRVRVFDFKRQRDLFIHEELFEVVLGVGRGAPAT